MRRYIYLGLVVLFLNCDQKREVLLPEISNAKITEVLDVSPAYIFYDDTQPDSTLLNRNNLISTTNWLVNVDKRLTLRQAIPHIQFLQNKKRNAKMHKNEKAKNFFTCHDISIKNLGFIDFTEINYKRENPDFIRSLKASPLAVSTLKFYRNKQASINSISNDVNLSVSDSLHYHNTSDFTAALETLTNKNVTLLFDERLTFQEYISIKNQLQSTEIGNVSLSKNEYLFGSSYN